MADVGDKPFWLKCMDCAHIWIGAYYPMEVGKIAKLLSRCQCPKCGAEAKHITMAKQDDGKLLEPAT